MKRMVIYKAKGAEADFSLIESYLGSALKPIQPRPVFVTGLRSKLATESRSRQAGLTILQYLILAAVGIGSGILLILTGARAIVAILGVLSVLRLNSGQTQKKPNITIVSAS
jgi:hypothetical protein